MFKRFVCLGLVLVMLLGMFPASALAQSSDLSLWAEECVNLAIWSGLVPSHLQSDYTEAITRAEFAALAVALYENRYGQITGRNTFEDTDDENVEKAAYIGLVIGIGNNLFAPDENFTRQEAATLLTRLADVIERPFPREAPTFSDNSEIASWAFDAVGHAQAAEIMIGIGNNTFNPSGTFTREESIVTMLRMFTFAWGSPLDGLLNVAGWEDEDWAYFDGWMFDFWGSPSDTALLSAMHIEPSIVRTVPQGGETHFVIHNNGAAGLTVELYLSAAFLRQAISTVNALNRVRAQAELISTLNTARKIYTITPPGVVAEVVKKMASMVVSGLVSDANDMLRLCNGYGVILTTRLGSAFLVSDQITVRSQFNPMPHQPSFIVRQHGGAPYYAITNDPSGPRGRLSRGTVVTVVGQRYGSASRNEEFFLLDTDVWVHSIHLGEAVLAGITASADPQIGGTVNGTANFSGQFPIGQHISLFAQPNDGWEFVGWYENNRRLHSSTIFPLVLTEGRALQARFRPLPNAEAIVDLRDLLGLTYHQITAQYGNLIGTGDGAGRAAQAQAQGDWSGFWTMVGFLSFPDVELYLQFSPDLSNWNVDIRTTDPRTLPVTRVGAEHPMFHIGGITINSSFNDIVARFGQPTGSYYWTAGEYIGFERGKTYYWRGGIGYSRVFNPDGSIGFSWVRLLASA